VVLENEEGRVIIESKGKKLYSEGEESYYPSEVLKIPKGHMPPPGKCRILYPDRPPGHQPSPGDCEDLKSQVPPVLCLYADRLTECIKQFFTFATIFKSE
jgi:hypothetical protein